MSNTNKITKILLGVGCLFAIVSIFCLLGNALTFKAEGEAIEWGSVFSAIFANGNFTGMKTSAGLVILFVFEILAIIGAIVIAIGIFTDKIPEKCLVWTALIVAVILLVCAVLGFCTKAFIIKDDVPAEAKSYFHLGVGAILYSVFSIIGLLSFVGAAAYGKFAKK